MAGKFEEPVYQTLSREPVIPNEIAKKLEISDKKVLRALMHLALTKEDVFYKNSGRIHIFWIETVNKAYSQKAGAAGVS